MQIDYTAKRSIQAGHSSGTGYTINIDLTQSDRMSSITGTQNKSINGSTVTVVNDDVTEYQITTVAVGTSTTPDIDDMREFMDSVKGGETFQLDISGSSASYVLSGISNPFTETRLADIYYRYSFKVRAL